MNNNESNLLSNKINQGVQNAIIKAMERHRKLGESIAISQNGKVIILPPEKIPLDIKDEKI
jgi:hypothetical protein